MRFGKHNSGEVSLGYLFKFGFVAFVGLCINATFDFVSDTIYTYKVQVMMTSPLVKDVKQCVYSTIMDGSYLSLPNCAQRDSYRLSQPETPIQVSTDGVIALKEIIHDTEVSLKLTPNFRGDGQIEWDCSGELEKYLPDNCSLQRE